MVSVVLADKIAPHAVVFSFFIIFFFLGKSVTESPEGTTNGEVDLALGKSLRNATDPETEGANCAGLMFFPAQGQIPA